MNDTTYRHDCDERCNACFECYRRSGATVCQKLCRCAVFQVYDVDSSRTLDTFQDEGDAIDRAAELASATTLGAGVRKSGDPLALMEFSPDGDEFEAGDDCGITGCFHESLKDVRACLDATERVLDSRELDADAQLETERLGDGRVS